MSSKVFHLLGLSLIIAVVFVGFGCKKVSKDVAKKAQPITLKVWRVFDDEDAFSQIITAYTAAHPYINIEYRKFRVEDYEAALLNALAADQGPDLVSMHNTWMNAWQARLLPSPATINVAQKEITGTIKKEAIMVLKQSAGVSPTYVANQFPSAVYESAVLPEPSVDPAQLAIPKVYGLPLAFDTIALFYNRELLSNAGIATPPVYWNDIQSQVKKLTKLDSTGAIVQSGLALGTAANVDRAPDILSLLMMQNGAQMTDKTGTIVFDRFPDANPNNLTKPPGVDALIFYTDFANPTKEVYAWNATMPNSVNAFANGQAAFFLGYAYDIPIIRARAPRLDFGITAFPQIKNNQAVYFANYWLEAVSKKTKYPNEAWDLVRFMASQNQVASYLKNTKRPAALLSLQTPQLEDLDLSTFAAQATSAKVWYHGSDAKAADKAMNDMITTVVLSGEDPRKSIQQAAAKVNQTVK